MEFTTLSTKDKTLTGQITTTDKIENICGVECYEENGTAYLKLESVARGLGFTEIAKSGNECIRWRTVRKYLQEISIAFCCDEEALPEFIPENIFYRLAMKAKNETAEKFQALVADKIIPSIRKNGGYIANQEKLTPEQIVANALIVAHNIIAQKDKELEEKRKKLAILAHVNKTYTMTEIAKELNLKSATELNKLLADRKIQYKINGTWVFYSRFSDLGYEEIKQEVLDSGRVIYHRKITQLGREFILSLFDEVA